MMDDERKRRRGMKERKREKWKRNYRDEEKWWIER